jgi:hypothetical protein
MAHSSKFFCGIERIVPAHQIKVKPAADFRLSVRLDHAADESTCETSPFMTNHGQRQRGFVSCKIMKLDTPILFAATTNSKRSRKFYEEALGLKFVADDPFALVFETGPLQLRIQKVKRKPQD